MYFFKVFKKHFSNSGISFIVILFFSSYCWLMKSVVSYYRKKSLTLPHKVKGTGNSLVLHVNCDRNGKKKKAFKNKKSGISFCASLEIVCWLHSTTIKHIHLAALSRDVVMGRRRAWGTKVSFSIYDYVAIHDQRMVRRMLSTYSDTLFNSLFFISRSGSGFNLSETDKVKSKRTVIH